MHTHYTVYTLLFTIYINVRQYYLVLLYFLINEQALQGLENETSIPIERVTR